MIKRFVSKLRNSDLVMDNLILFTATLFTNICSFVFHSFFGRVLGPADYGSFGAIMSLVYLMLIPLNTVQTGIAKFVTLFKVNREKGKVAFLLKATLKRMIAYAFIVFVVFMCLSPFLGEFLKLSSWFWPLFFMGMFFFFSLMVPITRGVLQGLQKFKGLGAAIFLEGFSKLGIGAFFILIGVGLNGAVFSFVFSLIVSFLFSLWLVRKWFSVKGKRCDTKGIYAYSFPVLLSLISLNLFYSIDVILVKHFFESAEAGYYAAFALLSKVVFFGSISISQVLFPKSSELFAKGRSSRALLLKSLAMVGLYGGLVTLAYYLFPNFFVGLLFGDKYLAMSGLAWLLTLVITLFSLVYVLAFYNLSLNRYGFLGLLYLFNILQIGLIWVYHSSLLMVMEIFLILMALLLVLMLGVSFREAKHSSSCA